MPVADAIAIRLAVSTRSRPPVPPLDAERGATPQIWRGEDVDFALGVFDSSGFPVDLSNLFGLEIDLYPWPIPANKPDTNQGYAPYSFQPFPTVPPAPILTKTILAADLTALITSRDWENGTDQNAIASFSFTELAALNLGGKKCANFGFVVKGLTAGGRKIFYGGGPLTVFEGGDGTIYLPNDIAPVDVPAETVLYLQPNQQLPFSLPISVEGVIISDGGTLVQY